MNTVKNHKELFKRVGTQELKRLIRYCEENKNFEYADEIKNDAEAEIASRTWER